MKILFVCLGNICRSPIAETVFNQLLAEKGLTEHYEIDSAGLDNYHESELADPRMRRHAELHGYNITHRSRPIKPSDFNHFDLILGMDPSNIRELLSRASEANRHKIKLLGDYCQQHTVDAIPDPYLGVDKDFEYVIELVEDACAGLLLEIESNSEHTRS